MRDLLSSSRMLGPKITKLNSFGANGNRCSSSLPAPSYASLPSASLPVSLPPPLCFPLFHLPLRPLSLSSPSFHLPLSPLPISLSSLSFHLPLSPVSHSLPFPSNCLSHCHSPQPPPCPFSLSPTSALLSPLMQRPASCPMEGCKSAGGRLVSWFPVCCSRCYRPAGAAAVLLHPGYGARLALSSHRASLA